MQQAGNLQLVAVLLAHLKAGQWAAADAVGGLGQHHGQRRHPLTMTAGIRRLLVNCRIDQADQAFEQTLLLLDQQSVRQGNRSLRGQRLHQLLIGRTKRRHRALLVDRVDQLQHANHFALPILHRHGEEGHRSITVVGIELARSGEVETTGVVGVGNIHRFTGQRSVGHHRAAIGLAITVKQVDWLEINRLTAAPAHAVAQAVVANHFEHQLALLFQSIQGATIGTGQLARRLEYGLQQAPDIALRRQRCANFD